MNASETRPLGTVTQQRALAVLCLVLFMTFLDNTIVSVALADIQQRLGVGVQTLQWVVDAYALTFAGLMLAGGVLGDVFGRRLVMLIGISVFAAGSIIAAFAAGSGTLLAGRAIMGIGAAASEPGTLSLLRHVYKDPTPRARALGVWAATSGTALALGPVIAGVLVGLSDWRAVFWFNLVLGGSAFLLVRLAVPESRDESRPRFDLLGAALVAMALASTVAAIIAGETASFGSWWVMAMFAVGGLSAAAFVVVELHTEAPLLELRYLRIPRFLASNVVAFVTYFGIFCIFFFVALYLQLLANQSPYGTALDFVPMAFVMVVSSLVAGRWVARAGPRWPMTIGCLLAGGGILLVDAVLGPHAGFAQLGWSLPIAGAGFGVALVPVTSAALAVVPSRHSGMAAATTNTSRELGALFGVAVLGAVLNARLTSNLKVRLNALGIPAKFQRVVEHAVTHGTASKNAKQASGLAPAASAAPQLVGRVLHAGERAFYTGLHYALVVSAVLLFVGAVVAFVGCRRPPTPPTAPTAPTTERPGVLPVLAGQRNE